jgi:hypothetical protein
MSRTTADDAAIWGYVIDASLAYLEASRSFLAEGVARVPVLRKALREPGLPRMEALRMIPYLKEDERKELFEELVFLASWANGAVQCARDAIRSLPRDWVLARIEEAAEPLLAAGTDDEYRRFLELYELLDRALTLRLARRAAASEDLDIREAGEDFLAMLGEAQSPRAEHESPDPS